MDDECGPRIQPKRTAVVTLYTQPPTDATIICVDELGPIPPRSYPPAPGWTRDGHRIKAPLDYSRGPEKVWVYGGLRVADGVEVTLTAPSRNTAGYLQLLTTLAQVNPEGEVYLIADNLASHTSAPMQAWLAAHPRVQQVFIPKGAWWRNLQEGWWRLVRREALAGQSFVDDQEIRDATRVATQQLNQCAQPWVWGRAPRPPRYRRRRFVYLL